MPPGRKPNPLTPNASLAHAVGAQIRAGRERKGWTLERCGHEAGFAFQYISDVERAKVFPSYDLLLALDEALGTAIADQYEPLCLERAKHRTSRRTTLRCREEVDEDVRRRQMLKLGLCAALLGPEAAARASAESWERVAHGWAHEVATAADRKALLPGLVADLRLNPPARVDALLSSFVASIAVSAGKPAHAKWWWRRARAAAVRTGDRHVTAYATGRQAIQGLYSAYSPAQVVTLADAALAVTATPCTGRMEALAAKGQALAMLNRARQAREVFADLERDFERLPDDMTREHSHPSMLTFAEVRMHNSRSFAGMFVGGGEPAREQALGLYANADWRGIAQVQLHRAAEGDADQAVEVLNALTAAQRSDRFVRLIATRTLASCQRRGTPGTNDLRDILT